MSYISKLPGTGYIAKWPRRITLLGCTGSIGCSALNVLMRYRDFFIVHGLGAGRNIELLAEQARVWHPPFLAVQEEADRAKILDLLDYTPEILVGQPGYEALASHPDTDVVLSAQVGRSGLRGTAAAARAGKVIALANKESLVLAGGILRRLCAETGAVVLPVDSEHNAIFQCLLGQNAASLPLPQLPNPRSLTEECKKQLLSTPGASDSALLLGGENVGVTLPQDLVKQQEALDTLDTLSPFKAIPDPTVALKKIILTASGGAFRGKDEAFLQQATRDQALRHPTWSMGAKVTIDSASLMNKGMEIIEACHLFGLATSQVDVVVHPQSIVHSLVQYTDNSQIAQLGPADMRVPISNCLGWPYRLYNGSPELDLVKCGTLSFESFDQELFPAPKICRQAYDEGRGLTIALNAANELAVSLFLAGGIGFFDIFRLVRGTLDAWPEVHSPKDIEEVLALDSLASELALNISRNI